MMIFSFARAELSPECQASLPPNVNENPKQFLDWLLSKEDCETDRIEVNVDKESNKIYLTSTWETLVEVEEKLRLYISHQGQNAEQNYDKPVRKNLEKVKDDEQESKVSAVLQCSLCSFSTLEVNLFEEHLKSHSFEESDENPNVFICKQCGYRTSRKMHYARHIRDVHRQFRPYLCHSCGKAFKRPEALKQHTLLHTHLETESKSKIFNCKICGKICRSQAHLREHFAVHSNERSFLCEICGASFKTRSVQRKHVSTLHQNPRAFACGLCDKRFNTNYGLKRHMKQHQDSKNGPKETKLTTQNPSELL